MRQIHKSSMKPTFDGNSLLIYIFCTSWISENILSHHSSAYQNKNNFTYTFTTCTRKNQGNVKLFRFIELAEQLQVFNLYKTCKTTSKLLSNFGSFKETLPLLISTGFLKYPFRHSFQTVIKIQL